MLTVLDAPDPVNGPLGVDQCADQKRRIIAFGGQLFERPGKQLPVCRGLEAAQVGVLVHDDVGTPKGQEQGIIVGIGGDVGHGHHGMPAAVVFQVAEIIGQIAGNDGIAAAGGQLQDEEIGVLAAGGSMRRYNALFHHSVNAPRTSTR